MSFKIASTTRFGFEQDKPRLGEWSFVNNCGPNENEEARRLIRANAMRDFWRRKKQQKSHNEVISARDKIPLENLVSDSSFYSVWRIKQKPHSSQEMRSDSDCETESAVKRGYNVVSPSFDETHCIDCEGRDCGENASSGYHWIAMQQVPGLPISLEPVVIDPFNAVPIGGSPRYNSFVLRHCKSPLALALPPFGLVHILPAKR